MEVTLVRWPEEAVRRTSLAAAQHPRLLLVADGTAPPELLDCFEDWVRLPATDTDVSARLRSLQARCVAHRATVAERGAAMPEIDDDGLLRFGAAWTALPPVEGRLARALSDRFGVVVGRDALVRATWPGLEPARNALDVHILRLRRRLGPVGLAIRTVRSRGYLMEAHFPMPPPGWRPPPDDGSLPSPRGRAPGGT